MQTSTDNQTLYDHDFFIWTEQQAKALKEKDCENIDWENVVEEIESLGRELKHELCRHLRLICQNLLLLKFLQDEKELKKTKLRCKLMTARHEIELILDDAPSLNQYLEKEFKKCFSSGKLAARIFCEIPEDAKITLEHALDENFFADI